MTTTTTQDAHAIVLGSGMAGLLAARALSDRFDQVTVVDRDGVPGDGRPRPGAPQGHHVHALLARGQQVLEELFPGLTGELAAAGAPTGDVLGDAAVYLTEHRLASTPTGLLAVNASRPLLEHHVRGRVEGLENVSFAAPTDVVGLVTDSRGRRITGVRVLRHADSSAAEVLEADLVVDALGRTSRAHRWLRAAGCCAPTEEHIEVDLRYSTRSFRAHPDDLDGLLACICAPTPERPRGCALARIEHGRWMLTLAGMAGASPPRDPGGFTAFARSIGVPEVDEVLDGAAPLDDPAIFRFPSSVRRRYAPGAPPAGFLAVGDSLCSLNPVYGQGMSVAALQALALLAAPGATDDERWSAVSRPADDAWAVVRATDLAFPGVGGWRSPQDRILGAYVRRIHTAAATDPVLAETFMRVAGLVDRPSRLLRPEVAARTLVARPGRGALGLVRRRTGGGLTAPRLIAAALVAPIAALAGVLVAFLALRAVLGAVAGRRSVEDRRAHRWPHRTGEAR